MKKQFKTSAAECAEAIRKELKEKFPRVKFKINSSTYSMGDSVSIFWVDGINSEKVRKIVNKYQYGSFNGMEDIYEFDNQIEGLPQSKWIQVERKISEETYLKYFEKYAKEIEGWKENVLSLHEPCYWLDKNFRALSAGNYIYRQTRDLDLNANAEV